MTVAVSHPLLDADDAIEAAIRESRGGVSVLITGQRADRVWEALEAARPAPKGIAC